MSSVAIDERMSGGNVGAPDPDPRLRATASRSERRRAREDLRRHQDDGEDADEECLATDSGGDDRGRMVRVLRCSPMPLGEHVNATRPSAIVSPESVATLLVGILAVVLMATQVVASPTPAPGGSPSPGPTTSGSGGAAFPPLIRSSIATLLIVNERLAHRADELGQVIAVADPLAEDIAAVLRGINTEITVGNEAANRLLTDRDTVRLGQDLMAFYETVATRNAETLGTSIRSTGAYVEGARAVIELLDGLGPLNDRLRAALDGSAPTPSIAPASPSPSAPASPPPTASPTVVASAIAVGRVRRYERHRPGRERQLRGRPGRMAAPRDRTGDRDGNRRAGRRGRRVGGRPDRHRRRQRRTGRDLVRERRDRTPPGRVLHGLGRGSRRGDTRDPCPGHRRRRPDVRGPDLHGRDGLDGRRSTSTSSRRIRPPS